MALQLHVNDEIPWNLCVYLKAPSLFANKSINYYCTRHINLEPKISYRLIALSNSGNEKQKKSAVFATENLGNYYL